MRVLYFGTYERAYPRNAQVISCLRRAGVEVAERHVPVWEGREHKWSAGASAALRLAAAEARLLARPREAFDALLVGYPGHLDLPAARRAARLAPGRLQPARLAVGHAGRRPRPLSGRRPGRPDAARDRPSFPAGRRPGGLRHRRERRAVPLPRRRKGGCVLRRRRGTRLRAGVGGRRPGSVRGEADPAARARDDPRRRTARTRPAVPDRRERSARPSARRPAGERGARALGRVREPAGRAVPPRPARSGSSVPRRRPRA